MIAKIAHNFDPIQNATYGIAFFGTPHRGSSSSTLRDVVEMIAKATLCDPTISDIESLKNNAVFAESVSENYRRGLNVPRVLNFYEARPDEKLGLVVKHFLVQKKLQLTISQIVDRFSATLDLRGTQEGHIAVDSDHRNICKFSKPEGDEYRQVAQSLIEMRDNAIKDFKEKLLANALQIRTRVSILHPVKSYCTWPWVFALYGTDLSNKFRW